MIGPPVTSPVPGPLLGLLFVCALLSAGVLAFSLTLRLPAWVCVLNAFVAVLNLAMPGIVPRVVPGGRR